MQRRWHSTLSNTRRICSPFKNVSEHARSGQDAFPPPRATRPRKRLLLLSNFPSFLRPFFLFFCCYTELSIRLFYHISAGKQVNREGCCKITEETTFIKIYRPRVLSLLRTAKAIVAVGPRRIGLQNQSNPTTATKPLHNFIPRVETSNVIATATPSDQSPSNPGGILHCFAILRQPCHSAVLPMPRMKSGLGGVQDRVSSWTAPHRKPSTLWLRHHDFVLSRFEPDCSYCPAC